MSFLTILVLSQVTFWILSQFDFFVTIGVWVFSLDEILSFVTMGFGVLSQFQFLSCHNFSLSFVEVWLFEFFSSRFEFVSFLTRGIVCGIDKFCETLIYTVIYCLWNWQIVCKADIIRLRNYRPFKNLTFCMNEML